MWLRLEMCLKLKLLVDNFPKIQIIATGSSSFDLANEINEPLINLISKILVSPKEKHEEILKMFPRSKTNSVL